MIPVGAVVPFVEADTGKPIGFCRCIESSEFGVWVWVGPEVKLAYVPPDAEAEAMQEQRPIED